MNLDPNWVPMKWPCGPLEWARRNKSKSAKAELKDTLDAWAQPAALDLLKGTPVNCLVVEWAAGGAEDPAQQQALKPLLEAGRARGINFVGRVAGGMDAAGAVASARTAGLSAVMLAGPSSQSFDLPIIVQSPRDKVAWDSATRIFCATENEWPGLKLQTMRGDNAIAGPTGVPWVNSNAWFSLLSAELASGKTRWLDFDPPNVPNVAERANYPLAAADSQAYGSRWIISLDDELRAGLLKDDPRAKGVWDKTCETLVFFESHRGWAGFPPQGILAVVSDFRDDNDGEVLNLLNRRRLQFQVRERSKALASPASGLKAILWLDKDVPAPGQLANLLAFVRQGGLVIASAYWGPSGVIPTTKDPSVAYKMYNVGQGQIAVTEQGFLDPYQVALDTHLLVSRRNDLVRLYNPATTNCHYSLDPVHQMRLVQIVNYSPRAASYVTLWVNAHAPSARLWMPKAGDAAPLTGVPGKPGTEFDLPTISVNCAVEVGRLNP